MNVLRSLVSTPAPNVAIEIASDRVTVVSLGRGGPGAVVTAHATEALAPGAVVPAVNEKNVQEPAVAAAALERALERLGRRPRRAALVVPDAVAKVSIVRFDEVPARAHDLEELVRWQVRKTAPFRIEDAQVVYTAGIVDPGGGADFVVALTRRSIVEEYEQICQAAGVHAGIVDLSSFNLVNTIVAGSSVSGDWLLVHIAPRAARSSLCEACISFSFGIGRPRGSGSWRIWCIRRRCITRIGWAEPASNGSIWLARLVGRAMP